MEKRRSDNGDNLLFFLTKKKPTHLAEASSHSLPTYPPSSNSSLEWDRRGRLLNGPLRLPSGGPPGSDVSPSLELYPSGQSAYFL